MAVTTGQFSSHQAILTFLRLALGGLAVGYVLTQIVVAVKSWAASHFGEEAGPQIVISLLIPFAAYLVSEHLHVSGILASVAAGVTMSQAEITGQAQGKTRLQRKIVWDAVQYAANGAIFVLLGWWLPRVLATAPAITQ
jgi:CPA1 family monovalent cation:H+ antiporter